MKTLGRCLQLLKATFQVILCRQAEISIHKANLIHRSPLITLLQSLFALKTLLRLNFDYLHVKFTYVRYMYGMDHTYVPGYVKFFQIRARTEYFESVYEMKKTRISHAEILQKYCCQLNGGRRLVLSRLITFQESCLRSCHIQATLQLCKRVSRSPLFVFMRLQSLTFWQFRRIREF